MESGNRAFVTPAVVRWARERARATRDRLAKRLNTNVEKVDSWERGASTPTFGQAHKLAEALSIPFGYLFLPCPPNEQVPIPDFRKMESGEAEPLSANFISLLNDVLVKHQRYRELLSEEGRSSLPFVGKFTTSQNYQEVAKDIVDELGLTDEFRRGHGNLEAFISGLIRQADRIGVIVMKSGVVAGNPHRPLSVKEFRGFAISDPVAPLIFINGKDAPAAQIFTFAHEIVHIWIGATGISDDNLGRQEEGQNGDIEEFCNHVAAEVLLPEAAIASKWHDTNPLEVNIQEIAREYKVSSVVVLRKAYSLRYINWSTYQRSYEQERSKWKTKKSSGGNFLATTVSRNGKTLTQAFVSGALDGRLLYGEAARLLNVTAPTLPKIAKYLKSRGA